MFNRYYMVARLQTYTTRSRGKYRVDFFNFISMYDMGGEL